MRFHRSAPQFGVFFLCKRNAILLLEVKKDFVELTFCLILNKTVKEIKYLGYYFLLPLCSHHFYILSRFNYLASCWFGGIGVFLCNFMFTCLQSSGRATSILTIMSPLYAIHIHCCPSCIMLNSSSSMHG